MLPILLELLAIAAILAALCGYGGYFGIQKILAYQLEADIEDFAKSNLPRLQSAIDSIEYQLKVREQQISEVVSVLKRTRKYEQSSFKAAKVKERRFGVLLTGYRNPILRYGIDAELSDQTALHYWGRRYSDPDLVRQVFHAYQLLQLKQNLIEKREQFFIENSKVHVKHGVRWPAKTRARANAIYQRDMYDILSEANQLTEEEEMFCCVLKKKDFLS